MDHHTPAAAAAPSAPIGAVWILLLTGTVAALVYVYGYRQWHAAPAAAAPPAAALPPAPASPVAPSSPVAAAPPAASAPVIDGLTEFKLPDGTTLRAAADGAEAKLIAFVADGSRPVDKTTWFTLDRLEFDTSSASLRDTSNAQLDNLAAILRAFPAVKVKLGGYTDNTGDPQGNQQLSGQRAASAMAALVSRGIDSSRLDAEGYGEQFPVADNSTPEGRMRNRRTDLRVTAK